MFKSEDCSKHTIEFCGAMKEAVSLKQLEYKREKKRYLTIQRATEQIIREWKDLKQESIQDGNQKIMDKPSPQQ